MTLSLAPETAPTTSVSGTIVAAATERALSSQLDAATVARYADVYAEAFVSAADLDDAWPDACTLTARLQAVRAQQSAPRTQECLSCDSRHAIVVNGTPQCGLCGAGRPPLELAA